jgi:hypothetical protein
MDERTEKARYSASELEINSTVVVDKMDNEAWKAYGSAPSPAFVLDRQGRVILRQVWTNPDEIGEVLDAILDD